MGTHSRLPLIVLLFLFVSPAVTKESSSTWGQIIFGSPAQGTCKIITTYEVPILNCHCATNMTLKSDFSRFVFLTRPSRSIAPTTGADLTTLLPSLIEEQIAAIENAAAENDFAAAAKHRDDRDALAKGLAAAEWFGSTRGAAAESARASVVEAKAALEAATAAEKFEECLALRVNVEKLQEEAAATAAAVAGTKRWPLTLEGALVRLFE
jgi:hypothetical protein